MDADDIQVKLAEYGHAQDMLKHYDSLNWQIGSILIGANTVLLGLVANSLPRNRWWAVLVAVVVSAFSFALLRAWFLWFERHRDLYNFRNETLQRIEAQLGMYHFLRVAEAHKGLQLERGLPPTDEESQRLLDARDRAYGQPPFVPLYPGLTLREGSGHRIAAFLQYAVPAGELALLLVLAFAVRN